jgi:hypothetical protein
MKFVESVEVVSMVVVGFGVQTRSMRGYVFLES